MRVSAIHSPDRFVETLVNGRAPEFLGPDQGDDKLTSQDVPTKSAAERFFGTLWIA